MIDRPKPYTSGELLHMAVELIPFDPLRVVATYANQDNWTRVHADQRCYWSWVGPVIVGYELADNAFRFGRRRSSPQRRYVVYGNGSSGDYDTLDEALAVLQCNRDAGDDSVRLYVEMDVDDQ